MLKQFPPTYVALGVPSRKKLAKIIEVSDQWSVCIQLSRWVNCLESFDRDRGVDVNNDTLGQLVIVTPFRGYKLLAPGIVYGATKSILRAVDLQ